MTTFSRRGRRGFTLLELIVTLGTIALLMSILIPAIARARESSRQLECRARLRNLGIAITGFTASSGYLPDGNVLAGPPDGTVVPRSNWIIAILPWMEQQNTYQAIDLGVALDTPQNRTVFQQQLPALLCPSDITGIGGGDLSYVVNGGLAHLGTLQNYRMMIATDHMYRPISLDGQEPLLFPRNDDDRLRRVREQQTGLSLFFPRAMRETDMPISRKNLGPHERTPAGVRDGMSNTLMLAENFRTGRDPYENSVNWGTTSRSCLFFGINPEICKDHLCRVGNVDLRLANGGIARINSGLTMPEGEAPWPNSFHSQGVNVVFADGSARFLSELIDGITYFDLVTPDSNQLKMTAFDH